MKPKDAVDTIQGVPNMFSAELKCRLHTRLCFKTGDTIMFCCSSMYKIAFSVTLKQRILLCFVVQM